MDNLFTKNDVEKMTLFKNLILKNNLSNQLLISCNNKVKLEKFTTEIIKFLLCLKKKEQTVNVIFVTALIIKLIMI